MKKLTSAWLAGCFVISGCNSASTPSVDAALAEKARTLVTKNSERKSACESFQAQIAPLLEKTSLNSQALLQALERYPQRTENDREIASMLGSYSVDEIGLEGYKVLMLSDRACTGALLDYLSGVRRLATAGRTQGLKAAPQSVLATVRSELTESGSATRARVATEILKELAVGGLLEKDFARDALDLSHESGKVLIDVRNQAREAHQALELGSSGIAKRLEDLTLSELRTLREPMRYEQQRVQVFSQYAVSVLDFQDTESSQASSGRTDSTSSSRKSR